MSKAPEPDPLDGAAPQHGGGDSEEVDGLVVLGDQDVVVKRATVPAPAPTRSVAPAVQAAAVAATGFVAGAAVIGLVSRRRQHHRRSLARTGSRRRVSGASGAMGELVQIVGSRSLLVDVHLLGGQDKGR